MLSAPSDVSILQAISDPDRYRILLHLLREPATQKELAKALQINSGTLSKHMQILASAELARRTRSHSAYEPLFETRLRELLRGVANLKLEILQTKIATAEEESAALTRSGIQLAEDPMFGEGGE
jgi:DNA-binding HxlR family transcriptional regulator